MTVEWNRKGPQTEKRRRRPGTAISGNCEVKVTVGGLSSQVGSPIVHTTGQFTWYLRTRITHKILLLSVYRRAHPVHVHSIHHGDTVGHHIRLWVPRGMRWHQHWSVRSHKLWLWVRGWPRRNVEMMGHRKPVSVRNRSLRVWWVAHWWGLSQRDTRGWNGYLITELRELVRLLRMWVHLRRHWPAI